MKTLYLIILAVVSSTLTGFSQTTPGEVVKLIEDLKKFENAEKRKTEKKLEEKKEAYINQLEKEAKRLKKDRKSQKAVSVKKLIQELKREMRKGLSLVDLGKNKVVVFDQPYYYNHPVEKYKEEIGSLTFYMDGRVVVVHRHGKQERFRKTWHWVEKGNKLVVQADNFHGPFYVTKKSSKELSVKWEGQINKTGKAVAK